MTRLQRRPCRATTLVVLSLWMILQGSLTNRAVAQAQGGSGTQQQQQQQHHQSHQHYYKGSTKQTRFLRRHQPPNRRLRKGVIFENGVLANAQEREDGLYKDNNNKDNNNKDDNNKDNGNGNEEAARQANVATGRKQSNKGEVVRLVDESSSRSDVGSTTSSITYSEEQLEEYTATGWTNWGYHWLDTTTSNTIGEDATTFANGDADNEDIAVMSPQENFAADGSSTIARPFSVQGREEAPESSSFIGRPLEETITSEPSTEQEEGNLRNGEKALDRAGAEGGTVIEAQDRTRGNDDDNYNDNYNDDDNGGDDGGVHDDGDDNGGGDNDGDGVDDDDDEPPSKQKGAKKAPKAKVSKQSARGWKKMKSKGKRRNRQRNLQQEAEKGNEKDANIFRGVFPRDENMNETGAPANAISRDKRSVNLEGLILNSNTAWEQNFFIRSSEIKQNTKALGGQGDEGSQERGKRAQLDARDEDVEEEPVNGDLDTAEDTPRGKEVNEIESDEKQQEPEEQEFVEAPKRNKDEGQEYEEVNEAFGDTATITEVELPDKNQQESDEKEFVEAPKRNKDQEKGYEEDIEALGDTTTTTEKELSDENQQESDEQELVEAPKRNKDQEQEYEEDNEALGDTMTTTEEEIPRDKQIEKQQQQEEEIVEEWELQDIREGKKGPIEEGEGDYEAFRENKTISEEEIPKDKQIEKQQEIEEESAFEDGEDFKAFRESTNTTTAEIPREQNKPDKPQKLEKQHEVNEAKTNMTADIPREKENPYKPAKQQEAGREGFLDTQEEGSTAEAAELFDWEDSHEDEAWINEESMDSEASAKDFAITSAEGAELFDWDDSEEDEAWINEESIDSESSAKEIAITSSPSKEPTASPSQFPTEDRSDCHLCSAGRAAIFSERRIMHTQDKLSCQDLAGLLDFTPGPMCSELKASIPINIEAFCGCDHGSFTSSCKFCPSGTSNLFRDVSIPALKDMTCHDVEVYTSYITDQKVCSSMSHLSGLCCGALDYYWRTQNAEEETENNNFEDEPDDGLDSHESVSRSENTAHTPS